MSGHITLDFFIVLLTVCLYFNEEANNSYSFISNLFLRVCLYYSREVRNLMQQGNSVKELIRIYSSLNEASRCTGREPTSKLTSKIIQATNEIAIPRDKISFESLVKNLFILFYESSGYGKRLPSELNEENIIKKLKELRNACIAYVC